MRFLWTTGRYLPQGLVKADKLMLNFGSPRPPVKTVPLGLATCCSVASASRNWSMEFRRVVSTPVVNLERDINTMTRTPKVRRLTDRWWAGIQGTNPVPMWINNQDSWYLGLQSPRQPSKRRQHIIAYNQLFRNIRTAAPEDLEPDGPIFARSLALAMGDSVTTYRSTTADWLNTAAQNPIAQSMAERIVGKRAWSWRRWDSMFFIPNLK